MGGAGRPAALDEMGEIAETRLDGAFAPAAMDEGYSAWRVVDAWRDSRRALAEMAAQGRGHLARDGLDREVASGRGREAKGQQQVDAIGVAEGEFVVVQIGASL